MACKVCPTDCTTGALLPTLGNDCPLYDTSSLTGILISAEALPSVSADPNFIPGDASAQLTTVSPNIVSRLSNAGAASDEIRNVCIEGSLPSAERTEMEVCGGGFVNGAPLYSFAFETV